MSNGVNPFDIWGLTKKEFGDIDFDRGIVCVGDFDIRINELSKVDTIHVDFEKVKISFTYYDDGYLNFLYSDTWEYAELLKKIAETPKKVGERLRSLQNDYGVEHELWAQLLHVTFGKFNINPYAYASQCNISRTSDFISGRYRGSLPKKVEDKQEVPHVLP